MWYKVYILRHDVNTGQHFQSSDKNKIYKYVHACRATAVMSDSVILWAVAHQAPLSMGILPARILEWVVMPSSGYMQVQSTNYKLCHSSDSEYDLIFMLKTDIA